MQESWLSQRQDRRAGKMLDGWMDGWMQMSSILGFSLWEKGLLKSILGTEGFPKRMENRGSFGAPVHGHLMLVV